MASRSVIKFGVIVCLAALAITTVTRAGTVTDFEDLSLQAESYWNGSSDAGGFTSGAAQFNNNYDQVYHSWDGFSYSNITDTATSGMNGQYNSITGGGQGDSENYAVGYVGGEEPPTMTLNTAAVIEGLYITNNNYAYYAMLNGDAFSKKFGGMSGNDADWLLLTITGKDINAGITGTVNYYLADYRFADSGLDYIVDTWEYVDLTSLGVVKSVEFTLASSDSGLYGMNTPAYFTIDTVVPEPCSLILLLTGGLLLRRYRA